MSPDLQRRVDSNRPPQWEMISSWLAVAVFAIYAVLPTRNYYWDGVSFAQDIEQAGGFGSPSFWLSVIRPNHLLYDSLGYFVWIALRSLGFEVRAITVLQAINMALAGVCVAILQRTLLRLTQSVYLSAMLSLLFALSAIFWRFATDADAYIPSVLLLVAAFHILCASSKPRPLLIGILHVGAMLIHQLAIFFFPPLRLAFIRRAAAEVCCNIARLLRESPCLYIAPGFGSSNVLRAWELSCAG